MGQASGVLFTSILVLAAIGDLRARRISNVLIVVLALLGIAFSISQAPYASGAKVGFEGIGVGLACWLPFYALGWLGGGDVKLFAAAGAWLGPARAVEGALIGALAGAVLAILWMIRSRGSRNLARTLGIALWMPSVLAPDSSDSKNRSTLPYGVAIAFGAMCAGWLPKFLLG